MKAKHIWNHLSQKKVIFFSYVFMVKKLIFVVVSHTIVHINLNVEVLM